MLHKYHNIDDIKKDFGNELIIKLDQNTKHFKSKFLYYRKLLIDDLSSSNDSVDRFVLREILRIKFKNDLIIQFYYNTVSKKFFSFHDCTNLFQPILGPGVKTFKIVDRL